MKKNRIADLISPLYLPLAMFFAIGSERAIIASPLVSGTFVALATLLTIIALAFPLPKKKGEGLGYLERVEPVRRFGNSLFAWIAGVLLLVLALYGTFWQPYYYFPGYLSFAWIGAVAFAGIAILEEVRAKEGYAKVYASRPLRLFALSSWLAIGFAWILVFALGSVYSISFIYRTIVISAVLLLSLILDLSFGSYGKDSKQSENETHRTPIKKVGISLLYGLIVVISTASGALLWVYGSGLFLATFIRSYYGDAISDFVPDFYEAEKDSVTRIDGTYSSPYPYSGFTLYYPSSWKAGDSKLPVLFWMHGGFFLGGSRTSLEYFATHFAFNGYAMVSLDYAVAPETTYPAPVFQLSDAIDYFKTEEASFPMVDMAEVFVGGDSAGAQMAAQYVAAENNPSLASDMGLDTLADSSIIKGTLLFCGPYDLGLLIKTSQESSLMRMLVDGVGWPYFGTKDFLDSNKIEQATIVDQVTSSFPATYLTDGDQYSFKDNAESLAAKLKDISVPVTEFYPDSEDDELDQKMSPYPMPENGIPGYTHEYQFDWENYPKAASENFDRSLAFVKDVLD